MRRLLLLVLLLLLPACGVPVDDVPRALRSGDAPLGLVRPSTPPDPAGPGRVALYFVRDGTVVLAPRPVPTATSTTEVLELLFAGPTEEERARGLSSVIPASLSVEGVALRGRTAVVTLGGPDEEVVRTLPLAYAQIVATLAPGRAAGVRFRLDDADLAVPRGDGSLSDAPLDRSDYADLYAPAPAAAPTPSA